MKEKALGWINIIFQFGILALVVATPFLFWNLTSEYYEIPKFLFFLLTTVVLLILWAARWIVEGKVSITRTPLDLPLLLFLVVLVISTFFSEARPIAILGNLPRIHGGLATFVVYIISYFVLVSNIKNVNIISHIIKISLFSGVVLSVLTLLSYAGINYLTLPWTAGLNFTPTGSSFTTTALLVLMLPFPLIAILQGTGSEILGNIEYLTEGSRAKVKAALNKVALSTILVLFAAVITLTGSIPVILAALAVFGLTFFATSPTLIQKNMAYIVAPIAAGAILAFVSFIPLAGSNNIFYNQAKNYPRELQLPFDISWKISVSAFRDAPFWGSGPASFLFDFTTYKPVEFNNSKVWNIRFDTAFNEYLQVLATLGATGLIALLFLTAVFVSAAFKALSTPRGSLGLSLAISGLSFFILLALHPSTAPFWIMGVIILACFMAVHKDLTKQIHVGTAPVRQTMPSGEDLYLHFDALPTVLALVILGTSVFSVYQASNLTLADYHHRQALNAVALGKGLDAYNSLVKAEGLNPNADLYRTDLAQTNFALANAIAVSKGPTEASPAGSLTDEDKQNIQTLLSQAINEGRAATTLSPNNPVNWEILGSIYRQISGVAQNALTFSLDSYGRAIQKDPLNPLLRLTVGGIYYSAKNLDMAIRFFSDAVNLKPDYANAYYNLAVALRDKGDLVSAASSAERTVSLLDPKSDDYKAASELLASLKDTIASKEAELQAQQAEAPAAKTSSALQGKNLPQVLDLPKPENIATPPAVKKQTQE